MELHSVHQSCLQHCYIIHLEKIFPGDMVFPEILARIELELADNPFQALPHEYRAMSRVFGASLTCVSYLVCFGGHRED